jgi:methylase of polypeptide subunit release factors
MTSSLPDMLVLLGRWLRDGDYQFVTVTPATHGRVNARPEAALAQTLRDVFGWSRPFAPGLLPALPLAWLRQAGLLDDGAGLLRSRVRFSTLGDGLYAHSAYPTTQADAVFFGPDTYRFVALIERELDRHPLAAQARILDLGCGAGPGGIAAALAAAADAPDLVLADINAHALDHARANAALAGIRRVRFGQGDLFEAAPGAFDLIVANPPYLVDAGQRAYRHGGGTLGSGLSLRIVEESLARLTPGGRLILYTGAPIIDGGDPFLAAAAPLLQRAGCSFSYRELDPDVFGEELDTPAYARADRIAAVALVAQRPAR